MCLKEQRSIKHGSDVLWTYNPIGLIIYLKIWVSFIWTEVHEKKFKFTNKEVNITIIITLKISQGQGMCFVHSYTVTALQTASTW